MEKLNSLSIEAVSNNLADLGLTLGDTVMIHSAFSTISDIENGAAGFIQACDNVIGTKGTILMPVFNWDILHQGDSIIYDELNTRSKMGYLTEYFRTLPGTRVTRNLFNPLAVRGANQEKYSNCPSHTSWGEDSPFRLLYENDAMVLMVGTDYNSVTMFHVSEDISNVPYRFVYEFPNAYWQDKNGKQTPLENSTLRRYDGFPTDFNKAGLILEELGLVNMAQLGGAVVRSMRSKQLVDSLLGYIKDDPEFLIMKTEAREFINTRADHMFDSKKFIYTLWKKNRALLSSEYDWSLDHIAEYIPLDIKRYPSGMNVWDWTIPEKWENMGGDICSPDGKEFFDLGAHPLNVAAGSVSFEGTLNKTDLMDHVVTDPDRPNAIPYRTLYYDDDWKICLPHSSLEQLQGDSFKVRINTSKSAGHLSIGEYTIQGDSDQSILFPLHLDHPGQCNDNLSGIAAAIELIHKIKTENYQPRYTLRFVFLPETIGIVTYLSQNETLIPDIKWGIVFDSIGSSNELMFMKSLVGETRLDLCTKLAFEKRISEYREYDFLSLEGYGNDERALQVPGVDIPSVSVSRFPYPQYHSSQDNPDIISLKSIRQTRELIFEIIKTLDLDSIPVKEFKGVPQLSKIPQLKELFISNPKNKKAVHRFMFLMDGRRSISQIAYETSTPFEFAYVFFKTLEENGKVSFLETI